MWSTTCDSAASPIARITSADNSRSAGSSGGIITDGYDSQGRAGVESVGWTDHCMSGGREENTAGAAGWRTALANHPS